jgi:hypothetical protein
MNVKITRMTGMPPPEADPGLYFDHGANMLYIVTPMQPSNLQTSWSMPAEFGQLLIDDSTFPDTPGPLEQIELARIDKPEIRGLNADDLKEILAMKHGEAAIELVKQGRGT